MAIYNGHLEDANGNILLPIPNSAAAKVETGTTATQAYTKGALFYFNNKLCKATKAISSGTAFDIGNNCVQTYLGTEISSHFWSSTGVEFTFQKLINGDYY